MFLPLIAVAATLATPAPVETTTLASLTEPAIIEDPNWIRTPTMDELVAVFPVAAIQNNASGEALIECRIEAQGQLDNCYVLTERGGDYGFGAATVQLAQHFRMAPQSLSGQPTPGALVRLPMVWKLN